MEYISRHLENRILEISKSFSAILLTGPRQSGKTTMLRRLAEKENTGRSYVTLDDLSERDIAKNDPNLFLQLHKPPVLIDEVQYAPELFSYIKIHIDEHHNPGDFWMVGSQTLPQMRGVQETLVGRVALLHMLPLSQREITGDPCVPFDTNLDRLIAEQNQLSPVSVPELFTRLWQGSMPGVVSGQFPDRAAFYSSFLSSNIEHDARELLGRMDALKFNRFVSAVAARCSQPINYSALAEDVEIDIQISKSWVNILEKLGIIFLLYPYSNSVLKRTVKAPKVFFYDTGLVCYLTRWSSPEVAMSGAQSQALLENYAVSEIVKSYRNAGLEPFLYYYRDRDAKEIDVILECDGKLCPQEIKMTATPDKRLTRVFSVIDKSPLQRGTGAVLCLADHLSAFDHENLIVPIWMI